MKQFYSYPGPFSLECGGSLPGITVAYHTFGTLNADKSNVIWVMHGLTANSDVADWWPGTVGPQNSSTRKIFYNLRQCAWILLWHHRPRVCLPLHRQTLV